MFNYFSAIFEALSSEK